jgi:cytochrome c biogenesis protein ResB
MIMVTSKFKSYAAEQCLVVATSMLAKYQNLQERIRKNRCESSLVKSAKWVAERLNSVTSLFEQKSQALIRPQSVVKRAKIGAIEKLFLIICNSSCVIICVLTIIGVGEGIIYPS